MLDELSRWRLQPLGPSIELLNVFLGDSHDKAITESVALGVLDVAKEFLAKGLTLPLHRPSRLLALRLGRMQS